MEGAAPQTYSIRDLRAGEVQTLFEVDRMCFPSHLAYSRMEIRWFLKHSASISKLAETGEKVLGFIIGQVRTDSQAHIITLDVIPEARRRKIGSALMETLHTEFRRWGAKRVILEVETGNAGAQAFYKRFGYEFTGILPGSYREGSDAYSMVLRL